MDYKIEKKNNITGNEKMSWSLSLSISPQDNVALTLRLMLTC